MADNIELNPGDGGDFLSALDVGSGVKLPRQISTCSSAAITSVADSASSVTLLASNANRVGAVIWNDSTEVLYVKCGTTASATSFTWKVAPDGYLELPSPVYTGRLDGIWAANASGNAVITEFTF